MEAKTKKSELCMVFAGNEAAPNKEKFFIGNGKIALTQGGLIHSIEVNGKTIGNPGPGRVSHTLEHGEYWNGFEINSSPYLTLDKVVNGFKLTTNKGNFLKINTEQLPVKNITGQSAIVKDCFLYGIEVVYGSFLNQIKFYYISDFNFDE